MSESIIISTPVGPLYLEADDEGLTAVRPALPADKGSGSSPYLSCAVRWFESYFRGMEIQRPPLSLHGTPFRISVWNELLKIPFGTTVSYADIAERLGTSSRAVGGAVGANTILIMVPCHRVIGSDGSLTGFAYGLDMKLELLRHEGNA